MVANDCQIALLDLKTRQRKTVIERGSAAQFDVTGHLVYAAGQTMKMVAFDPVAELEYRATPLRSVTSRSRRPGHRRCRLRAVRTGTLAFLSPSSGERCGRSSGSITVDSGNTSASNRAPTATRAWLRPMEAAWRWILQSSREPRYWVLTLDARTSRN